MDEPCASEPAQFPTGVKEVVTLLAKSRRSIFNAMGVRFSRAIDSVLLAFKRCMQGPLFHAFLT
jgi:hypothetical protein